MPQPEVLVMDEWIGSGDKTFTERLSNRLNNYVDESSALVIASHNLNLVRRVCTHGLLLHGGEQLAFGKISDVLNVKRSVESDTSIGGER